ncbi:hypothetical protein B0J14DRAFT_563598 [Halenospora varia]|nr:hypothetical protein B0J14DRAFT_563598 [Halenospora varia]
MNSGNFLACAKCNELATIKCERCHEAPPYENQPIHKSYYYLSRGVLDEGYDASSVIFKLASPKEESMRRKLKKFMVEKEEGDVRDRILLRNAYSLAAMVLVNFMQVLLGQHKNTHLKLITTGNTNHTSGIIDHIVYIITTMNEEVWVMDISGAQFGYPRPLESWPTYERDQVQRICKQGYLGTSKNAWLDRAASFPGNSVPLLSSVLKQELHISEVLDGEIWQ